MEPALETVIRSLPMDALADLLSIGVCPRCIFRFFGLRDAIYTNLDYSYLLIVYTNTTSSDTHSTGSDGRQRSCIDLFSGGMINPCIVCLGILHADVTAEGMHIEIKEGEHKISSTNTQILQAVKEDGHQFDMFGLEVTLPGVVLVRERALWQYLQAKYGSESWLQGRNASEHVVSLKEALKWASIEPLERVLEAKFEAGSIFRIVLLYKHPEASSELDFLGCTMANNTKRKWNGGSAALAATRTLSEPGESLAAIQRSLASMPPETFNELYPFPPPKLAQPYQLTAMCYRTSIYIGGRYLKFSRNISQSCWLIHDERMGDGSVQEIIADVVFPQFKADSYKFHAAGREDIDVRMLGSGRPFMLEISNARTLLSSIEVLKLENQINSSKEGWVKVRNLKLLGSDAWNLMLEGETEKQKQYTAIVWLSRPVMEADIAHISGLKDLEIQQKTPVRVLHRRSPLVRSRIIHWMRCERAAGTQQYIFLHLCTQAGTYVKEFVHGDLGRTYPNIGSLLTCEAEILLLDVTDIKMDFFD